MGSLPGPTAAWLAIILAAGLAIRLDRLGGRSYWFDEGFSWKIITFPWREMIARVAIDNHGPPYFLVLKLWAIVFGDSPWSLRFLSVLMGELTILAMFFLAREAYQGRPAGDGARDRGDGIGLVTAALVALSTFHIRWSEEVRMYTLGTALAAFSGWLLLRALWRPGPPLARWLAYGLVTAVFAYTHPYAMFSIAAQAIFALGALAWENGWRPGAALRDVRLRWLLLSFGMAFVLWSPWLPVFLAQRRQVGATFWLPPMSGWQVARTCYQMFIPARFGVPSVGAAGVALVLCVVGLALLLRRAGPPDWFVFLSAAVPFVASGTLSFLQFNIWHRQYFLFAHLFLLATIAVLISRIRARTARRLVAAAVLLGFLEGIYVPFGRSQAARATVPGARAAAAFLDGRRAPGETAIVCSPMLTPSLEGHSHRGDGWRSHKPAGDFPHYMGTAVIRPGELITPEDMEHLGDARVWVVDVERWEKGTCIVPVPAHWSLRGEWRFPEIYGDGCEIIVREYAVAPRPR